MTGKNEGIFVHGVEFGVEKLLIDGAEAGPKGHNWIVIRPNVIRDEPKSSDSTTLDPQTLSPEVAAEVITGTGIRESGLNSEQRRIGRITIDELMSQLNSDGQHHAQLTPPGIEMNSFDGKTSLTLFVRLPEGEDHEAAKELIDGKLKELQRERDLYRKRPEAEVDNAAEAPGEAEDSQFLELRSKVAQFVRDTAPGLSEDPSGEKTVVDEITRFMLLRMRENGLDDAVSLDEFTLDEAGNDNVDVTELKPNDSKKATGTNPT